MSLYVDPLGCMLTLALGLAVATLLLARSGMRDAASRQSALAVVTGTLLANLASTPWLFAAGWILTLIPFRRPDSDGGRRAWTWLVIASAAMVTGFVVEAAFPASVTTRRVAFGLIATAVAIRQGCVPFHLWIPDLFAQGSVSVVSLFLSGQLALTLLVRFGLPLLPPEDRILPSFAALALITAAYSGLLAAVATRPRRTLALLYVGQNALVAAGALSGQMEGTAGAVLHLLTVALAMTTVCAIYEGLEARTAAVIHPRGLVGLGAHAPRLAALFGLACLALLGTPGSLGFVSTDLIVEGTLATHPVIACGLLLSGALTAVATVRLFGTLFLGREAAQVARIPEARPRERWAFTGSVALLILGGLVPQAALSVGRPAAAWILAHVAGVG